MHVHTRTGQDPIPVFGCEGGVGGLAAGKLVT